MGDVHVTQFQFQQPVVVMDGVRKEFSKRSQKSGFCKKNEDQDPEQTTKVRLR